MVHVAMRTRRQARLAATHNWLPVLEIAWVVWLADSLCFTKRRILGRTCKAMRDRNREFRARRSMWFNGLMQALKEGHTWLVRDRFTYEHRRRTESVNVFITKWVGAQDLKAQRYLRFERRLDFEVVHIKIEDFREETHVGLGNRKFQWNTQLKMNVTFTFAGAVLMKFEPTMYRKMSWHTRGSTGPATDSVVYSDSRQYQGVQLNTWEDLHAWLMSPEFTSKPLDTRLVPAWQ